MGVFSPDVWTHCNYIAETLGYMFLTHCDASVPTFTILDLVWAKPEVYAGGKYWTRYSPVL